MTDNRDDGLNVKGKCKLIDEKDIEDKQEKKSTSCEETSAEHSAPRAESSTSSSDSKQIPQAKPAGIQGSIYMQMYLDSVNETSTTHELFQQAAIFAWRESDEMSQEELQAIYHWMTPPSEGVSGEVAMRFLEKYLGGLGGDTESEDGQPSGGS